MDGRKFRAKRNALGFGQEELGEKFGCTLDTISRWEIGYQKIRPMAWMALACLADGYDVRIPENPAELITRRRRLQLTQEELASEFGVTQETILRWENGHRPIRPMVWYAIRYLEGEGA